MNDNTVIQRPDQIGITLLQSLHVLNEMENIELRALEYKTDWENPLHPMAWGLFKTCLLKSTKNRDDLKRWSPELFHGYQTCHHCNGQGKNDIPVGSERYLKHLQDNEFWKKVRAENNEPDDPVFDSFKDGDPLWSHCSPCQGSGVLTKLDLAYEKRRDR